jgi:hypothetical protein
MKQCGCDFTIRILDKTYDVWIRYKKRGPNYRFNAKLSFHFAIFCHYGEFLITRMFQPFLSAQCFSSSIQERKELGGNMKILWQQDIDQLPEDTMRQLNTMIEERMDKAYERGLQITDKRRDDAARLRIESQIRKREKQEEKLLVLQLEKEEKRRQRIATKEMREHEKAALKAKKQIAKMLIDFKTQK